MTYLLYGYAMVAFALILWLDCSLTRAVNRINRLEAELAQLKGELSALPEIMEVPE